MSSTYEIPGWGDLQTVGFDERPRIETWDSREEMLAQIEARGGPWIEAGPHFAQAGMRVTVMIAGVTVVFATQMLETKQLVRFDGLPLWYLGWDTYVAGLDVATLTQVFERDLDLPIHTIARHAAREILVVHELGVVLLEPEGKEIWHTDARDIILRSELLPDGLHLAIWEGDHDEVEVVLDWETGKALSCSAGPASWWCR